VLLGAIPGFAVVRLPQIVGRYKAAEMMMLGTRITATEAAVLGLVNRVVDAEHVMDEAMGMARQLAHGAPLALQAIKATMRGSSSGTDMTLFLNTASALLVTNDARRGMKAFLAKETPEFEGS
jgi:enoyl-CoA hydratase/carnithine racemase